LDEITTNNCENKLTKVILSNMVSLDGFFEGPNRELDWHVVDVETLLTD
jgi:hypothetical protein